MEFERLNTDFKYDIRYVAHILNIIAGDIFKKFISTATLDKQLTYFTNLRLI